MISTSLTIAATSNEFLVRILYLTWPVAAQLLYLRLERCQLHSNSKSPL